MPTGAEEGRHTHSLFAWQSTGTGVLIPKEVMQPHASGIAQTTPPTGSEGGTYPSSRQRHTGFSLQRPPANRCTKQQSGSRLWSMAAHRGAEHNRRTTVDTSSHKHRMIDCCTPEKKGELTLQHPQGNHRGLQCTHREGTATKGHLQGARLHTPHI